MLQNFSIMTRLSFMIGVLLLALILSGLMSYLSISTGNEAVHSVYYGGVEEIQKLDNIKNVLYASKEIPIKILEGNISSAEGLKKVKESNQIIEANWSEYLKELNQDTSFNTQQDHYKIIQPQINELKIIFNKFEDILKKEDKEALASFSNQQLRPTIEGLIPSVSDLIDWHVKDSVHDYKTAKSQLENIKFYSILLFFALLLIGAAVALWIAYSITKPLGGALDIINKLTVGDLTFQISNSTKDEVGRLLDAMKSLGASSKKMSNALTAVSNGDLTLNVQQRSEQDTLGLALETMIKNLRHIVGELQSEVATLSSSSQEIVGSVSQVAAGSAETAAAVTETTTSVEELKQTAHISDEKAKDVLSSAEETLQIVNASEKSLQTTLEDMGQINEKMQIISAGIVKLSEHSQTIREIIDTVNDLAEQSNLLAVNAAIEAAKAGEHGKSFAVVAQEIRTLAEQSKAATVQVRSILNDIQNSTSEAVLATEQGSKAVAKGVSQSAQTSEFMQKLTQSMSRVAQAANQIAITSQQQLMGVDQVTVAMNSISDAAAQHVDHMKQIEFAVVSLNSVGETLKELTNKYHLNSDEQRK